jgi:hypothetical protein
MKILSLLFLIASSAIAAEQLYTVKFNWDRGFFGRVSSERCKAVHGYYPGSKEAAQDPFSEERRKREKEITKDYSKRIKKYLSWNPDQKEDLEIQAIIQSFEDIGIPFCEIEGSKYTFNGMDMTVINTKENIEKFIEILKPKLLYKRDWRQNQAR